MGHRNRPGIDDRLNLGETAFMRRLEALVAEQLDGKGARVAYKRNATGERVFAVILPVVPPVR